MQLACSRCSPIRISCGEYPRIRLTRELASSVNFILGTIPPVREIVIVISDLYLPAGDTDSASGAGAIGALPGFEHAARFGQKSVTEGGWRPWLARWLGRDDLADVAPAVIAAAALSDVAGETAWIATPIHLLAGLTSLHLDRRSILRLSTADLESFVKDFNRTFADADLILKPLSSGEFLVEGPRTLTGSTTEPARALVADLEASLPKGNNSRSLKRLGAELEMWLHTHPLNDARRRRGELPVSTLWLWGGGPRGTGGTHHQATVAEATSNAHSEVAFGTDPYLAGLWRLRGSRLRPLPDQLNTLPGDPSAQRTILAAEVTPMLQLNSHWSVFEALEALDRRFVSPALAALTQGEVESVVLIANDTELRVRRHDRLKFWRRRPSALAGLHP